MTIIGVGTDIVECLRIGQMIEKHGEQFLERVFTPQEMRYCQARKHATEHFAGRWAAKEAVLKCLGTGWQKGINWTDVEVQNTFEGTPRVVLTGAAREIAEQMRITQWWLSISHCRAYATAFALAASRD
ncbi:MAG: holo-ACP synthase [Gemmataceae bacterium]|nr:holo-ACP synthase [Gemmataceae bacterium]